MTLITTSGGLTRLRQENFGFPKFEKLKKLIYFLNMVSKNEIMNFRGRHFLMIKSHNKTGMKYLCKCSNRYWNDDIEVEETTKTQHLHLEIGEWELD